jgi:hypothetical protein
MARITSGAFLALRRCRMTGPSMRLETHDGDGADEERSSAEDRPSGSARVSEELWMDFHVEDGLPSSARRLDSPALSAEAYRLRRLGRRTFS